MKGLQSIFFSAARIIGRVLELPYVDTSGAARKWRPQMPPIPHLVIRACQYGPCGHPRHDGAPTLEAREVFAPGVCRFGNLFG